MGLFGSGAQLTVSLHEALALLKDDAALVDVREPDEWEAGHAPDAIHIPLAEVPRSPNGIDPTKPVLVICRSGRRSLTAAAQFRDAGLDAVSVNGGMVAWQQAGGLVVRNGGDPGTII
ncbi:unannotated protein [freshwater metagenome]|uniref:Unannotated protein n=1 Tax=freshwater metagenome TaxID=449393 RepID=A0A6J7CWY3_9ZZZZ